MDNLLVETMTKSYSEEEMRALELQAPHTGAPLPDTVVRSKVRGRKHPSKQALTALLS